MFIIPLYFLLLLFPVVYLFSSSFTHELADIMDSLFIAKLRDSVSLVLES